MESVKTYPLEEFMDDAFQQAQDKTPKDSISEILELAFRS
jgi:maltodextrin utilization protein YvdJ